MNPARDVNSHTVPRTLPQDRQPTLIESSDPVESESEAYHREVQTLSDLASGFLAMAAGDSERAVNLFDRMIDLLFEGRVLSMWRYRIILQSIRGQIRA